MPITEVYVQREEKAEKLSSKHLRRRLGAGVLSVLAIVGVPFGINHASNALSGAEFSPLTEEVGVMPGDSEYDIAAGIGGVERIDMRDAVSYIRAMPENTRVFENGRLDPGEVVTYPIEVIEN